MAALVAATALLASLFLPFAVKPWLVRRGVLDVPTARSSHTEPTIRGMGITVAAALLLSMAVAWLALLLGPQEEAAGPAVVLVSALVMAAAAVIGWIEDFRGIAIKFRAVLQLGIGLAGSLALAAALPGQNVWWVPAGAVAVAAYINVANFMDGINGISGMHGLLVGLFYAAAGLLTGHLWLVLAGAGIAAAFAGFLPWNLSRGNVFLGDVGSYLLGASIAVTAVAAFLAKVPVEYIFSPVLIYLADTFITLIRRIASGQRWYAAHRQHAYQRLTIVGLSHLQATAVVSAATVATGLLGIVSTRAGEGMDILAGVLCALVVLLYLRTPTIFQRMIRRRAV
ncbi:UDP-phosphate glycosyltransferase [Pseudarthrobacter sp. P1]|uniref:UDP-phosphate glycosyltransferase n=1 Tax=Pseudarthrobacter sp. P1 TaxID=3418418 RepID=UPI003CFB7F44